MCASLWIEGGLEMMKGTVFEEFGSMKREAFCVCVCVCVCLRCNQQLYHGFRWGLGEPITAVLQIWTFVHAHLVCSALILWT